MTNISASLTFEGKGNLADFFKSQNKSLTDFDKKIVNTKSNLSLLNKSATEYGEISKKFAVDTINAAKALNEFQSATRKNIKATLDFMKGTSELRDSLDESQEGFSGLGLKILGVKDEVEGLSNILSPGVDLFNEFADASSNVERAFIAIDKVEKPVRAGLDKLADSTGFISDRFNKLENSTAAISTAFINLSSKSLQVLSNGLDVLSQKLSGKGLFGKIIAGQIEGISEAVEEGSKSLKDFSNTIDPKDFNRIDQIGNTIAKSFEGSEKSVRKLSTAIKLADISGDLFRTGRAVKENITEGFEPAVENAKKLGQAFLAYSGVQKLVNDKWALTQKIAKNLDGALKTGLVKTLAQLTLQAGQVVVLTSVFKQISTAVTNAFLASRNLNDTLGVFSQLGINTRAFELATSIGFLGEQLLFSSDAARQFGQAAVAAFAQLEDAAAFVTTLSSGSEIVFGNLEKGTLSIAGAMTNLVSGPLKNTITSLEATNSLYNSLSAGIGVTRQGTVNLAETTTFLNSALKLSSATGTDAAQTVELLAKVSKVYGISNKEAAQTAAKLNAIVENGITTFPQLVGGFSRAASVAKASGVSFDEMSASVAALTTVMTTDDALTGLASLLQSIAGQGEASRKAISELGVSFDIQSIKSNGLLVSLKELSKASNGNTEVLKRIIPDALAFQTALQLMGGAADSAAANISKIETASEESLDKIFEARQENIIKRATAAMNGFNEVLIDFGQRALPIIEPGLSFIEAFLSYLQGLPGWAKQAAGFLILFQTAIATTGSAIGGIIGSLAKIGVMLVAGRLATLAFSGALGDEFKVLKNLVLVQEDYGGAILRLFGWKQNLSKASIKLKAALQDQLEIQNKLANKGVQLANPEAINSVKDYEKALKDLQKVKRQIQSDRSLGLIDPSTARKEKKELDNLEKSIKSIIKAINTSREVNLEEINTNLRRNFVDIETTIEEKTKSLRGVASKFFSTFPKEAQEQVSSVNTIVDRILSDTSLTVAEKSIRIQEEFNKLGDTLTGDAKESLPKLKYIYAKTLSDIDGVTTATRNRIAPTMTALWTSLPESIDKAKVEAIDSVAEMMLDLERPFIQRRNSLADLMGLIIDELPPEIKSKSAELEKAFNTLLTDSSKPLAVRDKEFALAFAKIVEQMPLEVRRQSVSLQAAMRQLVKDFEAPLKSYDATEALATKLVNDSKLLTRILGDLASEVKSESSKIVSFLEETLADPNLPKEIKNNFQKISEDVEKELENLSTSGSGAFEELKNKLKSQIQVLNSSLEEIADEDTKNKVEASIKELQSRLESQLNKAAITAQVKSEEIKDAVTEGVGKLETTLASLGGTDTANQIGQRLDSIKGTLKSSLQDIGITSSFESEFNELETFLKSQTGVIEGATTEGFDQAYAKTQEIVDRLNQKAEMILDVATRDEVKRNIELLTTDLKEGFNEATKTVQNTTPKAKEGVNSNLKSGLRGIMGTVGASLGIDVGLVEDTVDVVRGLGEESKKAATNAAKLATAQHGVTIATEASNSTWKRTLAQMKANAVATGMLAKINAFLTKTTVAELGANVSNMFALKGVTLAKGGATLSSTALATAQGALALVTNGVTAAFTAANTAIGIFWTLLGPITVAIVGVAAAFFTLKELLGLIIPGFDKIGNKAEGAAKGIRKANEELALTGEILKTQNKIDRLKILGEDTSEEEAQLAGLNQKLLEFKQGVAGTAKEGLDAKVKVESWRGGLVSLAESVTQVGGNLTNFIGVTKDANQGIRKFFNGIRENIQAGINKRFYEELSDLRDITQELRRDTIWAAEDLANGKAASEEGRAIQKKAFEERRALTEKELNDLLNLERLNTEEQLAINSERVGKLQELAEKEKEGSQRRLLLEQEINSITGESANLEAKQRQFEAYTRDLASLENSIQSSKAGQSAQDLFTAIGRSIDSLDTKESKQKMEDILGVVRAPMEEDGTGGEVIDTMFNINSGIQRQKGNALGVAVKNVITTAENVLNKDMDNRLGLDALQNYTMDFLEANRAAVEAGTLSLEEAKSLQDEILSTEIKGDNLTGTVYESLTPQQKDQILQEDIDFINRLSTQRIKSKEQGIAQINALEASNQMSGLEATKERALLEEQIDQDRLKSLEDTLALRREQEGSSAQQIKELEEQLATERLNVQVNTIKRNREIIEAEFKRTQTLVQNQLQALQNEAQGMLNGIDFEKRLIGQQQAVADARKAALDSQVSLEETLIQNELKRVRDVEKRAELELELVERKNDSVDRQFDFETKNLQIQFTIRDLDLQREQIQLRINAAKAAADKAEIDARLAKAEELKLTKQEVTALELQSDAQTLQLQAIEDQTAALSLQEMQQKEINQLELQTLKNREQAAKSTAAIDLEMARQNVVLSGYDKQVQEAENLLKLESARGALAQNQLKVVENGLNNQLNILERQRGLIQQTNDIQQSAYQTAASLTTSEILKRRLEKEAAIARLDNLKQTQAIEQRVFELQQKQNELALQRREIESEVAEIRAGAELAKAVAESERIQADKYATEQEKQAAQASVLAAEANLQATQMERQLVQQDRNIFQETQAIAEIQFQQKQEQERFGARVDVARTTTSKADDISLIQVAVARARGSTTKDKEENRRLTEYVNKYDVTRKDEDEIAAERTRAERRTLNSVINRSNRAMENVSTVATTPNLTSIPNVNANIPTIQQGFIPPPSQRPLDATPKPIKSELQINLNVTLDGGASNLPPNQQQGLVKQIKQTINDGLYELFEEVRKEL